MHFIDDAWVFDEKVANVGVFEKQRVRWLEAQINHIRRFSDADMKKAPRTGIYWVKYFQNFLLPRLLFIMVLGILFALLLAQWVFSFNILAPQPGWWLMIMIVYAAALAISVPGRFYSAATLKAVVQIPVLMLSMLRAILKIKTGRQEFIHTPKTYKP